MKPGIYNGIPFADYLAADGISRSGLVRVLRSPAHYKESLNQPAYSSTAFNVGTETHRLILEPETQSLAIQRPDMPRRSRKDRLEWRAFFGEHGADGESIVEMPANRWDAEFTRDTGKFLLTEQEMLDILAMRESVYAHEAAAALLFEGVPEQSIWWSDAETGELCKIRVDWMHAEWMPVDLKTCEDASPKAVRREIFKYHYNLQAAMYSDGCGVAYRMPQPTFVFVFVEKKPPYAVGVYYLGEELLSIGGNDYRKALNAYSQARKSDIWPAYSNEVEMIEL